MVAAQGAVPFANDLVARLGASLAPELAGEWLREPKPDCLIALEDSTGWSANQRDLLKYRSLLTPILAIVPSCIPSTPCPCMSLMATDAILEGRLVSGNKVDAFKYLEHSQTTPLPLRLAYL